MKQVSLIKVFIASPGDVVKQRDEVENLIWDWNNNHTDSKNIILMPIRYETNSSASYRENTSGQAVINEQIVKSSDILIAIFGNKIGTRTENGISGTVEEINVFNEEHGKGAGIFFIEDDNVPYKLMEQRKMVERYKEKLRNDHYPE